MSDSRRPEMLRDEAQQPAPLTAGAVEAAAERISDVISATPLEHSWRLSAATGASVFLKREDQQAVRSYKIRGAYNIMVQLDHHSRQAGVVTASAGNHAQGVAFACRTLQVHGRIYLPANTPRQKRDRIISHGGKWVELIIAGADYHAAQEAALADSARTGASMVPPFDHPDTVAGQGTIGLEILRQLGDTVPDTVVLPVGGGGLLAGVALYLDVHAPNCRIVAVEPSGASSLLAAEGAGGPVTLSQCDTFVDGAAVRRIGLHPWTVYERFRDKIEVVTVDEGAVCTEMLDLYHSEGIIAEPAGALAATALHEVELSSGSTVVAILSGGNNDVSRYSEIIERSLVHKGLKHYFLVTFAQEPGQLRRFLDEILGPEDDITLFEYIKRNNREFGAALCGIELGSRAGLSPLLARMELSPIQCERLEPGTPAYSYLT